MNLLPQTRSGQRPDDCTPDVLRWLLAILVALLIAYTLAPFEFSFSARTTGESLRVIMNPDGLEEIFSNLGHFLVFTLVGILLAATRKCSGTLSMRRFLSEAALACGVLELIQFLCSERHARASDFLINVTGLVLGWSAYVKGWRGGTYLDAILRWCRLNSYSVRASVILCIITGWVGASAVPIIELSKIEWAKDYRIAIGSELDGSEGWIGEMRHLKIYDRALTHKEILAGVRAMFSGRENAQARSSDPLVDYDFARRASAEIRSEGKIASERLTILRPNSVQWLTNGGLLLERPTLLISRGPVPEVAESVGKSGGFSIEAWAKPAASALTGPKRIAGYSGSAWSRNFMLGQEDSDLVLRVRNGMIEENGAKNVLRAPGVMDDSLQCIVAVYDHGVCSFFKNGEPIALTRDLRSPTVSLALGNNDRAAAAGAALLSVCLALPVYSMFPGIVLTGMRHAVALIVILMLVAIPYSVTSQTVGGPWRWEWFGWSAVAVLGSYPLALLLCNPGQSS
jgi:hypothetical protein